MKKNNLSRLELLQWLNEFTECDYPRVEMCCDGIGYCQILDAIHPNVIPLSKLNFNARFPDEFTYNLKILDDCFKKLKLDKIVPIDKLSKGKFQDNINFLQWLYNYATQKGPMNNTQHYRGYEKRIEAINKQRFNKQQQMNPHLIPNKAILDFPNGKDKVQFEQVNDEANIGGYDVEESPQLQQQNQQLQIQLQQLQQQQLQGQQQQVQQNFQLKSKRDANPQLEEKGETASQQRIKQLNNCIKEFEFDIKQKMEYNWKLMYALEDIISQRNALYNILKDVENICLKFPENQVKTQLVNILSSTPEDFLQSK